MAAVILDVRRHHAYDQHNFGVFETTWVNSNLRDIDIDHNQTPMSGRDSASDYSRAHGLSGPPALQRRRSAPGGASRLALHERGRLLRDPGGHARPADPRRHERAAAGCLEPLLHVLKPLRRVTLHTAQRPDERLVSSTEASLSSSQQAATTN